MNENQTLIEDMVTLGGTIIGNLMGARHEFRSQAKQRIDSLARHLDLVSREEFDAAFAMLARARAMQEELQDRLAAVEAQLGQSRAKPAPKAMKANLPSVKKGNRRRKRA